MTPFTALNLNACEGPLRTAQTEESELGRIFNELHDSPPEP